MAKLVILKLEGDLRNQGFQVTLEISQEQKQPYLEVPGTLPADFALSEMIQVHWREKYRSLAAPYRCQVYRIKPKKIIRSVSTQDCQKSAQLLQQKMENWLNSDGFRKIDQFLREELNRQEKIRVLVRTNDLDIFKLPWHLWNFFDRYTQAEPGFSQLGFQTSHLQNQKTRNLKNKKIRILVILGHKQGIDIEKDREFFQSLPQAEVEFLDEPTVREIQEKLWENQPWDILFFAGHSETEGETGRLYINPQDSIDITNNQQTNELWYALRTAINQGLKLAIFNSCDGLGLAQRLNDSQIPQMIVMRDLVPDQVAHEFLKQFLQLFSQGKSLYLSVREAREKLHILEKDIPCATWLPVIIQNPGEVPVRWDDLLPAKFNYRHPFRLNFLERFYSLIKGLILDQPLIIKIPLLLIILVMLSWGVSNQLTTIAADKINDEKQQVAIKLLDLSLFLNPYNSRAINNRGYVHQTLGNDQLAEEFFQKAHNLGHLSACNNLASYKNRQGNFQQAEILLQECLVRVKANLPGSTTHYNILTNLAWSLWEQSQAEVDSSKQLEAQQHLEEAVSLRKDRGRANCLLALIYYNQNQDSQAEEQSQLCSQEGWDRFSEEKAWKDAVKKEGMKREKLMEKE